MPSLPNNSVGAWSCGMSLDIKNLDIVNLTADKVDTKELYIDGKKFPDETDYGDITCDNLLVAGDISQVTIQNRNFAAEEGGSSTHEIATGKRANKSGNAIYDPPQDPPNGDMGIFQVNGRQKHHGLFTIERWPEGGPFEYLGPTMQVINEFALPWVDAFGVERPAMTSFQFGHDFKTAGTNKGAAWLGFLFYGDGDSRNCFVIDSNANFGTSNPAFVVSMTDSGIPSRIGIHTKEPAAPLDITGNTIIRDQSSTRPFLFIDSEGATKSVVQFKDTVRSTNYSMVDFDCYNGVVVFMDPVTGNPFYSIDNGAKTATFSSDGLTPFFKVDASNSKVSIYPALTSTAFVEFNSATSIMTVNTPTGIPFQTLNSANATCTFNRTSGGAAAFTIFDAANAKCAIGSRATEGLAFAGTNTTFTGLVGVIYGGLRVISVDTSNYCDLYVGMNASQNLLRTSTSTTQVMMGTSTPTAGALLTVAGNIATTGFVSDSFRKKDLKGDIALTGAVTLSTLTSFGTFTYLNFVWTANTVGQFTARTSSTLDGTTANAAYQAFNTPAQTGWKSAATFGTTGAYTGTQKFTFGWYDYTGEQVNAAFGAIYRMSPRTITFTIAPYNGLSAKDYIIYGYKSDSNTNHVLHQASNATFGSEVVVSITSSTATAAYANAWEQSYYAFGVLVRTLGGTATTGTTFAACIKSFSVQAVNQMVGQTGTTDQTYIPTCLEIGKSTSVGSFPTANLRVNGDSNFRGAVTFNQPLTLYSVPGNAYQANDQGYQIRWTPVSVAVNNTTLTTIATLTITAGVWDIRACVTLHSSSSTSNFSLTRVEHYLEDSSNFKYAFSNRVQTGVLVTYDDGQTVEISSIIQSKVATLPLMWKMTAYHNATPGGVVVGNVVGENFFYATRIA